MGFARLWLCRLERRLRFGLGVWSDRRDIRWFRLLVLLVESRGVWQGGIEACLLSELCGKFVRWLGPGRCLSVVVQIYANSGTTRDDGLCGLCICFDSAWCIFD